MKIAVCVVLALVAVASAQEFAMRDQFIGFKHRFGKVYETPEEENHRFAVFTRNMERAAALQAMDPEAQFGVTKFSDMTPEEFKAKMLNYKPQSAAEAADRFAVPLSGPRDVSSNADGFDWRGKGAITAVKDQGQCGSCWAFSSVEEHESMWYLERTKQLVELSPQQVVSCDKGAGDLGCNGGDTVVSFKYIIANGLQSEASYPYKSGQTGRDGPCTYDKSKVVATMSNFTYATPPCLDSCPHQDEATLQSNLEKVGPVSVCVSADSWQVYSGGILSSNCPKAYSALDHCVQLVGWATSSAGVKYWILRNSWAEDWGIQGYIHVKYGSNLCGLADEATHTHP